MMIDGHRTGTSESESISIPFLCLLHESGNNVGGVKQAKVETIGYLAWYGRVLVDRTEVLVRYMV